MFSFFSKKAQDNNLRDCTSTKKNYLKTIQVLETFLTSDIAQRQEAISNQNDGKQPYPAGNLEIIENTWHSELSLRLRIMTAHYSLGSEIESLFPLYESVINAIKNISRLKVFDYYRVLSTVSVALLLPAKQEDIAYLQTICEKYYPNDFLLNFLLNENMRDRLDKDSFVWPKPFAGCAEVVRLSAQSPDKAMARLGKYINTQWKNSSLFQKYEANKKYYYIGNWCFESAALVKILQLDDSSWQDKEYYPYAMKNR
jgi:hypothetical protein